MAKWEGDRLDKLREMAADGMTYAEMAKALGSSPGAVWRAVERHNVGRKQSGDAEIRRRWAAMIGPMRQQTRANVTAIMQAGP
jgi:hypothetical protein